MKLHFLLIDLKLFYSYMLAAHCSTVLSKNRRIFLLHVHSFIYYIRSLTVFILISWSLSKLSDQKGCRKHSRWRRKKHVSSNTTTIYCKEKSSLYVIIWPEDLDKTVNEHLWRLVISNIVFSLRKCLYVVYMYLFLKIMLY